VLLLLVSESLVIGDGAFGFVSHLLVIAEYISDERLN
jgi:hypothetical protein